MDRNPWRLAALVVALALAGLWLIRQDQAPAPGRQAAPPPSSAEGYLFCTWNVENFFDDEDDPKNHDEDEDWFARNPASVREKVALLAEALLRQNDGRGPDILAAVEVESRRAMELLRDKLNAGLPTELRYEGLAFVPNHSGRRFAPAVLSRLPVRAVRTNEFGIRRILEARIEAQGAPLTVLVSHWTSRVRDDTEGKREAYADVLYARVIELTSGDPAADVILAGDFNDGSSDPSIAEHLHATGDRSQVLRELSKGRLLHLFDLTAGVDPETGGTYLHNGRWEVLDHLIAAPGLLDPAGWWVVPESLRTENAAPLRSARTAAPGGSGSKNANPRGPSDHFALSVRLRIGP